MASNIGLEDKESLHEYDEATKPVIDSSVEIIQELEEASKVVVDSSQKDEEMTGEQKAATRQAADTNLEDEKLIQELETATKWAPDVDDIVEIERIQELEKKNKEILKNVSRLQSENEILNSLLQRLITKVDQLLAKQSKNRLKVRQVCY